MLLVGIDWAESEHAACLLSAQGDVLRRLRIGHDVAGVDKLTAMIGELEPDPARVLVAIETAHGLLVAALVEAGFTVYAIDPKSVERYRTRTRVSRAKTDPADAELLARILLTDRERHRPLRLSSAEREEIRALARDDERASRDQRRLLNRLRQDLLAVFPQALEAFDDLAAPTCLAFLARWPSAAEATAVDERELAAFFRERRHGWPERTAKRVRAALEAPALRAPAHLAQAKAGTIRLACEQLLLIYRQRKAWEKRLGELLEAAHPDGESYLSLPGLDIRLAARVLAEVGDGATDFAVPNQLQCYGGTAPVTRRSGKQITIACRLACNRHLRQAAMQWAFCSLTRSDWARDFYDRQRAAGKTHYKALRALGNRWLELLWHLLHKRALYDEPVHQRNRSKPEVTACAA
ncbi:MAG: IS110 family transposase [Gaiellaceae bacterium]